MGEGGGGVRKGGGGGGKRKGGGREESTHIHVHSIHNNILLYLLDSLNEFEEDTGDLSLLSPGHGALVEAAMLSIQGKHSRHLHPQDLSPTTLTMLQWVVSGDSG